MTYTSEELDKLHDVLYDILGELIRVCEELQIPYFLQGGSAMGAFYEQGILPWDDDIDVGMKREDYERFLREGPGRLKKGYFIQWVGSEPHFPLVLCKLRKDGTAFVEGNLAQLDMHHGIFVDIMAYDRVPDNGWLQKVHRKLANKIFRCIFSKEVWSWCIYRKPDIKHPYAGRILTPTVVIILTSLFSKQTLYRMYLWACNLFKHSNTTYYNQVKETRDHISAWSLEHLEKVQFGPLMANVPADLETYLRHHYGNIRRHIPVEEQINHYPMYLSFTESWKTK